MVTGRALLNRLTAGPVPRRTRFAPAPTGWLHLGHVVNAVLVWGVARAIGARVVLRVEDHDATRCREPYVAGLLDDLDWLGFVPDEGLAPVLSRQRDRSAIYLAECARLDAAGLVYACDCSRRALEAVAPHGENEERPYPGTCRDRRLAPDADRGLRLSLPTDAVTFDDLLLGARRQTPAEQCGDLLIRDRLGQWTYQFAVTVDDIAQEIDLVVRGRDLLASTGRQVLLARLLGRDRPPMFLHHTLLRRADGTKLSKSDGATGIRELRAAGISAMEVLGMAVARAGLRPVPRSVAVRDLPDVIAAAPGFLDDASTSR